ncbi:MAG TPA: class E sortase [Candidatus Binatia bacterium]|nr:class E sortase [Candidatus Binatia bacterium]
MRWRARARWPLLLVGIVLVGTGLGVTVFGLVQRISTQQAVDQRGQQNLNAVNEWLAGEASGSHPSSSAASSPTAPATSPSAAVCGGGSNAYALVDFSGLPQYGYAGVAVNGDWTRLQDRAMVHWYGSPAPGGTGNVIIAFHREPDYQYINELAPGQTVTIQDQSCTTYVYTITQSWDLLPTQVTQLGPTSGHELTLITCTPWWVDSQRLVWRAELTSTEASSSSSPS